MMYLAVLCAFLFVVLWVTSPAGTIVHAATPREVVFAKRRFPMAAFFKDINGKRIPMDNKVIGVAKGDSAVKHGITDRATVLADILDSDAKRKVSPGTVVIIDAETLEKASRRRFRVIKSNDGKNVSFEDNNGKVFDPRPVSDLYATVTHVA